MNTYRAHHKVIRFLFCAGFILVLANPRLAHSQALDSFAPEASSTTGSDWSVAALVLQPDGQILAGGGFTLLGWQFRNSIGRIQPDGSMDNYFTPAMAPGGVVAVQPDGKVLVGGSGLARLNTDGSLDTGFNCGVGGIRALALQPDGKIIVGGSSLARLNSDGTLDTAFNPSPDSEVNALALQPDGKIVVGGAFTTLCGQPRARLGRLKSDGTLDTAFSSGTASSSYYNSVYSLAVQADGKILVGGMFDLLGGQTRQCLGRLYPDGTVDPGFVANAGALYWDPVVRSLAVQTDQKILVGGLFNSLGGLGRTDLARLNADGTLDSGFSADAVGPADRSYILVNALAVQPDGKVLLGGSFTKVSGVSRSRIARLINTGPATQSLSFNSLSITWLRGGTGPEVWRTSFDASTNGSAWFSLGAGVRTAGGWQLTGISQPANVSIRARGFVGSGGMVESFAGSPRIESQPANRTNNAGTLASFTVRAVGDEPFSFQWWKGGTKLADGGNVSGANTASLVLSNVLSSTAGSYWMVVSNAGGSTTTALANLTIVDPVILQHPADQSASPGGSVQFTVTAAGTMPITYQWLKEGGELAGATNSSLVLNNVQAPDEGGAYAVVISNSSGTVTSAMATATVLRPLVPDALNPSMNSTHFRNVLSAMAVQPDGKILLGGAFTTLCGQPRDSIGRLNADGTLDTTFNTSISFGYDDCVNSLALQSDGKVLMGGNFIGGIRRLNANGSLDPDFHASFGGYPTVNCLAVQPDGKILLGGYFTSLGGIPRNYLARLNANGTVDTNFDPGAAGGAATSGLGYAAGVFCISVQPDGKILVGGVFSMLSGQMRTCLGRLNADGTPDLSFISGADGPVSTIAVQADGKILVGGSFSALGLTIGVGSQYRYHFGRLNPDGSLDTGFNPSVRWQGADTYASVSSLALQADGKILVRGHFDGLCGQARQGLGRLNPDGTLDSLFNSVNLPGVNLASLAVQSDGAILVGSSFTISGGQARTNLGRLSNTGPATQSLAYDGSSVLWRRGGTGPEVRRTSFDVSTDGANWVSLGAGERVANGWRIPGVSLPANATVLRARGFASGGGAGGTSWFVETLLNSPNSPFISRQPVSLTNATGTSVVISVAATGAVPLSYQWRHNGTNLTDAGRITGATGSSLVLTSLQHSDAGGYSVIVTNNYDAVTSTVAVVEVIDAPFISLPPTSRTAIAGADVTFRVTASGSTPLSYQWRLNGTNLPGATNATLTLTNVQSAQAGSYVVVVSNLVGSTTSAPPALLTVNWPPIITQQPVGQTVPVGGSASFSVTATSTVPLSYWWKRNGVPVPGATDRTFTTNNVRLSDSGSQFSCLVSNVFGTTNSSSAVLTVVAQSVDHFTWSAIASPQTTNVPIPVTITAQDATNATVRSFAGTVALSAPAGSGGASDAIFGNADYFWSGNNGSCTIGYAFTPNTALQVTHVRHLSGSKVSIWTDDGVLLAAQNVSSVPGVWTETPLATPLALASGTRYRVGVYTAGQTYYRGGLGVTTFNHGTIDQSCEASGDQFPDWEEYWNWWLVDLRYTFGGSSSVALTPVISGNFVNGVWTGSVAVLQPATNVVLRADDGSGHNGLSSPFKVAVKTPTVADYQFQNNLASSVGTPPDLALIGSGHSFGLQLVDGVMSGTLSWPRGTGLSLYPAGAVFPATQYSVVMLVRLDTVSSWSQLLDFNPGFSWTGLYAHNGALRFMPGTEDSAGCVTNQTWHQIVMTRNASAQAYVYCDGVLLLSFMDSGGNAIVAGDALGFFTDSEGYATGGAVARIRLYPSPLTASEVTALDRGAVATPQITAQPQSQTVAVGSNALFTVAASSPTTLDYQWQHSSTNLTIATAATLTLTNVQLSQAGDYRVIVSNSAGAVTSQVATLTVFIAPPAAAVVPANRAAGVGTDVTFTGLVGGSPPFSYQWQFNGTYLAGATNLTLVLTNVQSLNSGSYSLLVTNAYGLGVASATLSVAPVWLGAAHLSAGGLRFTLHGLPGKVCEIWACTNLPEFQLLQRLTNTTGTLPFLDSETNLPRRFYQVRQP